MPIVSIVSQPLPSTHKKKNKKYLNVMARLLGHEIFMDSL